MIMNDGTGLTQSAVGMRERINNPAFFVDILHFKSTYSECSESNSEGFFVPSP
jgi:hypothetical protein